MNPFRIVPFIVILLVSCNQGNQTDDARIMFRSLTNIDSISFRGIDIDENGNIWVTGTKGTVVYSGNKGKRWVKSFVPEADSLDFRDVACLGDKVLLMSIGTGQKSRIYRSADAGINWELVYQNEFDKAFFDGFDFWDEKRGIMISDAIDDKLYILRTFDGGLTWQRTGQQNLPVIFEGEYGFAASGTGIQTGKNGTVWIVTGGAASRVFISKDFGENWLVFNTPIPSGAPSKGIFSIDMYNDKKGLIGGGDYRSDTLSGFNLALTSDGGRSWQLSEGAREMGFVSRVAFLTKKVLLATGTSGTYSSVDGGKHWHKIAADGYHCFAYSKNSNIGVLAGSDGRISTFSLDR